MKHNLQTNYTKSTLFIWPFCLSFCKYCNKLLICHEAECNHQTADWL